MTYLSEFGGTMGASAESYADHALPDVLQVGGRPSSFGGHICGSGFKHALVLVLSAAALADGTLHIEGAPSVLDTEVLVAILSTVGASVSSTKDRISLDASTICKSLAYHQQAELIHGTGYLIPALLRRLGHVRLPAGGGCRIGSAQLGLRPTRHYVDVLRSFGVESVVDQRGTLTAHGDRWRGTAIDLNRYIERGGQLGENLYSGATKMAILMAAAASSPSTLESPYYKGEIEPLLDVLSQAGVECTFDRAHRNLRIDPPACRGLSFRKGACTRIPPDLIEIVTYITAGAVLATEDVTVSGVDVGFVERWLAPELDLFASLGVPLSWSQESFTVGPRRPEAYRCIHAHSHHGVSPYSDSQPFLALLAGYAAGESKLVDDVWPSRRAFAGELVKLGMDYRLEPWGIKVYGPCPPHRTSGSVTGADLRAAAVLTIAAAATEGSILVRGGRHLRRGYSDLPSALVSLGADIQWVQ